MSPDLGRIHQACHDGGWMPTRIHGNQFNCRCPSHGGQDDPNASFRLNPDGRIQFRCWSHHCHEDKHGWQMMVDTLDLTTGDFIPDHLRHSTYTSHKPRANAAEVARFAEAVMGERRLTEKEQREYRQALIQQHRGAV